MLHNNVLFIHNSKQVTTVHSLILISEDKKNGCVAKIFKGQSFPLNQISLRSKSENLNARTLLLHFLGQNPERKTKPQVEVF